MLTQNFGCAPCSPTRVTVPTMLLVDDDPASRMALSEMLLIRFPHATIHLSPTGDEALSYFRTVTYDVVITDFKMPGMNGLASVSAVSRMSPSTSVILVTAYATERMVGEAFKAGVYDVTYKPIERETFALCVATALQRTARGVLMHGHVCFIAGDSKSTSRATLTSPKNVSPIDEVMRNEAEMLLRIIMTVSMSAS